MSLAIRIRSGLIAALLLLAVPAALAQGPEPRVAGELIVRLAPGTTVADVAAAPALAGEHLVAKRLLVPALNIWLVGFDDAPGAERAAYETLDAVRRAPGVLVAQFNHEVTLRGASVTPNDTRFGEMWNLHNTGQTGGTPDADIDAPEAWELTHGGIAADGARVAVAVVDNGFQLSHPDLRFWTNPAEVPGNGVDDDGNGYVDDVNGWNAYNHNGTITSSFHGTHVSGTAAARGNNGTGVTGVNWEAEVVAIQGSSGNEATVVEAYGYALALRNQYDATGGAEGAFVVSTNSSFGVDFGDPEDYPIWCGMYDEMGEVGILSAAATMNINADVDVTGDVPTACPSDHLIAVTNTTDDDTKNSGAAYGLTTIDLGAPGTSVLSTNSSSGYGTATGTSMASPHVAGAVALLVSGLSAAQLQAYRDDPAAYALTLKQAILDGTDDIGIQTVTGGRLNVYNSLLLLQQTAAVTAEVEPVGGTSIPPAGGTLTFQVTLTNTTGQPQSVQGWTAAEGPVDRDPAMGPLNVTIPAGGTITRTLRQRVPRAAPAGTYTYFVNVGTFPDDVMSSDAFTFEKQAGLAARPAGEADDWAVSGWDDDAREAAAAGATVAGVGASPNPFVGATTLRFALAAPSDVRLAVYDVLGREVAVLADGPFEAGTHAVVFDAAAHPSGTYLYRLTAGDRVQTGQLTVLR
ncbi:MAG TPA: S8 family peptidase [Rubricoccaceae bacterium]|nr:S8 family peptidase [Rubricoccaceae bacterium]